MKFNVKGLFAIIGYLLGFAILINDLIVIIKGGSYTPFGIITLLVVLAIASESEEYIKERLGR